MPKQRPQPAVVGKFRAVWMSPHCQWLINGNTGEMVTKEEDGFCYAVISDLDDTCNYYYKQRYMVGEDGIPTPVLQDDEADDDQESIKCYKIFEVQKMIREDGSHFMFNLNTRQSVAANINFKELIYKNNESGDVFEFLVYRFQEPPGVSCVRSYVRLQDFQTVINLKMSCAVSAKWLQRNWDGWQREYSGFLKSIGFEQSEASPCVFVVNARNLATSVHGNDFTTVGPKAQLDWLEAKLESTYELRKSGRPGPGKDDAKEILVFNRAIKWTEIGLEYEADPRQAERLLEGLGPDDKRNKTATPGLRALAEQLVDDKALPAGAIIGFRGQAARANY